MFWKFNPLPLVTAIATVADTVVHATGRQPSWIARLLECTVEPGKHTTELYSPSEVLYSTHMSAATCDTKIHTSLSENGTVWYGICQFI